MTYRKLLLAACAGTGLFVAFGSLAMPFDTLKINAASAIDHLVDYDEGDDDDHQNGHRRHHDDRGRQASNDCRGDDEDDDDDDDGACGGRGGVMQQNATPPANGLFAPGSKPTVQVN